MLYIFWMQKLIEWLKKVYLNSTAPQENLQKSVKTRSNKNDSGTWVINIPAFTNLYTAMLLEAGQPEIFRAAQRDETFKKYLRESISEILQPIFGIHFWIKHKNLIERLSNVLYQCVTTMSNLQTLGEEYTGIIQTNRSVKFLPKKQDQLLMILLNNFGETIAINALQKFEKTNEQLPWEHFFNNPLKKFALLDLIHQICIFIKFHLPSLLKLHKALFYFDGHYYELSKRLCGIKYVLVRYWLKDKSSISAFKLLGMVTLIQSILGLFSTISDEGNIAIGKVQQTDFRINESEKNAHEKCPLCLNNLQMPSVTPCGHLFCWPCIFDWLQEQPKCPLCRQVFQPSRVVYLQNYSCSKNPFKEI